MGSIARILSFVRVIHNGAKLSDVEVDRGGGAVITAEHVAPPGDDSFPLKTDYVTTTPIDRTGGDVAMGYVDPINEPVAQEGEKRIYGRDPATGAVVNQVHLQANGDILLSNDIASVLIKADGSIKSDNGTGSFELRADGSINGNNGAGSFELEVGGDFVVNGARIDTAGNITSPTSVSAPSIVAAGKELAGHIHLAGTVPGNTGPNV